MTDPRQLDHNTTLLAVYYKRVTKLYEIPYRQIKEVRKIPSFPPEISHHEEHTSSTTDESNYCNQPEKIINHICLGSDVGKVSLSYTLQEKL